MGFIFKFLVFVFTVCVVQSKETIGDLISVKLNENIIYDCVDIYKQPSLSHPLLQNHKIQLKPSFSIFKQKNQVQSESVNKKIIKCPNGTVPILRNTKEYVANTQYWAEKHFNPLTVESHGTHIAGVRSQGQGPYHGVDAWISVHGLNISGEQASYAHIYVGSRVNNKVNFIQTGWMVNPSVFGDGRTWSYGFWKGGNGGGCYNTVCPGFVQVSKTDPLSGPLNFDPKGKKGIYISIVQDKKSGNWWVTDKSDIGFDEEIGYWPKEVFDVISNSVEIVGVGGAVQSSPSGKSPPMGNGHFPSQDDYESARVTHIEIVDSKFMVKGSHKYNLEKLLDNNKCYGLQDGKKVGFLKEPVLFTFGGPGGDACGI